jgi:hypothetical protein
VPETSNYGPFGSAWLGFVDSSAILLVPDPDDAVGHQYSQFHQNVLLYVKTPEFLNGLENAWKPFTDGPYDKAGKLLLLELQASPHAVQAAQIEAGNHTEKKKSLWRRLFGIGSTTADSVEKFFKELPGPIKLGLIALRELFDMFKGD